MIRLRLSSVKAGGETIDKIIAETGVMIDIDEEGNVSTTQRPRRDQRAKEIIAGLVRRSKKWMKLIMPLLFGLRNSVPLSISLTRRMHCSSQS